MVLVTLGRESPVNSENCRSFRHHQETLFLWTGWSFWRRKKPVFFVQIIEANQCSAQVKNYTTITACLVKTKQAIIQPILFTCGSTATGSRAISTTAPAAATTATVSWMFLVKIMSIKYSYLLRPVKHLIASTSTWAFIWCQLHPLRIAASFNGMRTHLAPQTEILRLQTTHHLVEADVCFKTASAASGQEKPILKGSVCFSDWREVDRPKYS